MYTLHATVHARPPIVALATPLALRGVEVRPLAIASNELTAPLEVTFEQTSAALLELPRMFCEPDGYFVWTGDADGRRWQIDGHLFDRHERMMSMSVKGDCPAEALDALLRGLGWPRRALVFQLTNEAVVLDEQDFRRWAAANGDR